MKKFKNMKEESIKKLFNHYGLFTFTCLIAAYFGNEFSGSLTFMSKHPFTKISPGNRGVLSYIINLFTNNTLSNKISHTITSIIGSSTIANTILIIISFIMTFLFWVLIKNVYKVIMRRIILESREYAKVPISRFTFLLRIKKWLKVSRTMLLTSIYYFFWCLTIVGAFIKRYSYYLVPYIVAENPDIPSKKAIELSRNMMNNHKWECFLLELSFIGYELLGYITMGITKVIYSNQYKLSFFTEYYTSIRASYIKSKLPGYEYLFDTYLYHKASNKVLKEAYPDIFELIKENKKKKVNLSGIKGFMIRNFGINLYKDEDIITYEEKEANEYKISYYKDTVAGLSYPTRLYPLKEKEKHKRLDNLNYMRSYSLSSIILLFFTFSMIGWLWEVFLHLINNGTFVNRGVLHGPWLPIYGSGGILILLLLKRFREHPPLEFTYIVILCGLVEYFTSLYLEIRFGLSWWNYNGYFLNLHGRICAEGLLVFGLGGMAGVYIIAPLLDNLYQKFDKTILYILCVFLSSCFIFDKIYSGRYPNTGDGISSTHTYYKERSDK